MAANDPQSGFATPPPDSPGGLPAAPGPWARFALALGLSPRAFQLPFRRADWGVTLLIVLAFTITSAVILRDMFIASQLEQAKASIESNDSLSAEQRDESIERLTSGPAAGAMKWGPVIGSAVVIPIAALLAALLLMLILNFGMGGQVPFRKVWFLAVLSFAPKAVGALFFTVLALARGSVDISFGPAAFLSDDALALKTFLRAFDLFEVWVFALQMIGVAIVTGMPQKKARTAVVILWVIYLIFMALSGLATGCMSGGGIQVKG